MKIEYRTPAGSGSYSTLADETGSDRISGYQPALRKRPQTETLAFSDAQFVADRGNSEWSLKFTVEREHTDAKTAQAFIASHAAVFGAQGNFDLQITIDTTVLVFGNCAPVEVTPSPHSDKSTVFSYAFVGSSYASAPA